MGKILIRLKFQQKLFKNCMKCDKFELSEMFVEYFGKKNTKYRLTRKITRRSWTCYFNDQLKTDYHLSIFNNIQFMIWKVGQKIREIRSLRSSRRPKRIPKLPLKTEFDPAKRFKLLLLEWIVKISRKDVQKWNLHKKYPEKACNLSLSQKTWFLCTHFSTK